MQDSLGFDSVKVIVEVAYSASNITKTNSLADEAIMAVTLLSNDFEQILCHNYKADILFVKHNGKCMVKLA